MTYGIAKSKQKAVVQGSHAAARTTDPDAVFYFYFDEKGSAFNQFLIPFTSIVTSPNEFTLLRFDVERDSRELVMMEMNEWETHMGTQENAALPFHFEKISGMYQVTPKAPLRPRPGEYCFLGSSPSSGSLGDKFPNPGVRFRHHPCARESWLGQINGYH